MNNTLVWSLAALTLVGCAGLTSSAESGAELQADTQAMAKASFTDKGMAKVDRLDQDALQQACSAPTPPDATTTARLEAAQMATIQWPADDNYLGDWKQGEKLAQDGKGMTWKDVAGVPNGGGCYNCHQITKAEISFGTVGPSLYHYGKLRGVTDPASAQSAAVVKYTWGKIWNAKAYNACSGMPRFGHEGILTEAQVRDVMALLLDPKSPVNQ